MLKLLLLLTSVGYGEYVGDDDDDDGNDDDGNDDDGNKCWWCQVEG